MQLRPLSTTGIEVSGVALGTWPMAGMTSLDVNESDSLATIAAALGAGINFFDTAYCYGRQGESEKLLAHALKERRAEVVIATKSGVHWDVNGQRVSDARPATLRKQCEESLRRLNTDRVELLYLHAPDPQVSIAESAGELRRLMEEGKTRCVGISNASLQQLRDFVAVCPLSAYQPCYNMLQREIELDILPWCLEHNVAVCVYWPLMKGLLTAKFARNHQFDSQDGRKKYPMYQGQEWEKTQDFLDELRSIAAEIGHSVPQIVINWTIHQPGITSALCGAKRPVQIRETAGAMGWKLSSTYIERINQAIEQRGKIVSRTAV
ncbi:MAG TPA: aldo/keto reductase [Pirellulales bacterium]|jgi:aryl-alcohol dehydrogenase-like predicted oxidoreductase|nr:aldo/keto reductase [Pirellulales bacterium]